MSTLHLSEQGMARHFAGGGILPRLIIDAGGWICAFNPGAARLFGAAGGALRRRHIRTLMPELPLQPKTIGYNLAYVRMWYGDGMVRESQGVKLDGQQLKLGIAITPLERKTPALLLIDVLPEADDLQLSRQQDGHDPALKKFLRSADATNPDDVVVSVSPVYRRLVASACARAISRVRPVFSAVVPGRQGTGGWVDPPR